jgi:uncharacterized secreted protein with C-terminal beta-propeller domain
MARKEMKRKHRMTQSLHVESMESRELMTATLWRGSLNIKGTTFDDVIEVRRSPNLPDQIQVVENNKLTLTVSSSKVVRIKIAGREGSDTITINESHGKISVPTSIIGGANDDVIKGGSGRNDIDGGSGRNAVRRSMGRDFVKNAVAEHSVQKFGSEKAFKEFLVKSGRSRAGFGSLTGRFRMINDSGPVASPSVGTTTTTTKISAPGFSETNTQVSGIDEADIIENDGKRLYVLSRGELLIIDAQNPDAPAVESRTKIDGWPLAEYLHEGRLTVISSVWNSSSDASGGDAGIMPMLRIRGSSHVQVTVYDVANPASPAIVSQTSIDGSYSDSRMVDGKLALIVQNDLLSGYWGGGFGISIPTVRLAGGGFVKPVSDGSLTKMIQNTPLSGLLPNWSSTVVGTDGIKRSAKGLISQPRDLYCPVIGNEANLMSVVLVDTKSTSPGIIGATSIVGGYSSSIYMNSKDLYIFSPQWNSDSGDSTNAQRFDIAGNTPTLIATGTFSGHLLNQFSADANGEYLRVATTQWTESGTTNAVYVLTKQANTLKVVGSITGIAPGESIQSVRFVGDQAYVVTFRQTDPLYSIDLSVPTAPKIMGELKIPGFSRYLQPFGEGYLIGIGRDADPNTGRTMGLKVSLFDVRDASSPKELASYLLSQPSDGWSWSDAEWDHHALGYFPELGGVIALPVQGYVPGTPDPNAPDAYVPGVYQSDLVLFKIDPATGISQIGTISHSSNLLRSARIGDVIYSVADLDMKSVEVLSDAIKARGSVELQKPYGGSGDGIIMF